MALAAKEKLEPDTFLASYLYEPSLAFYMKHKFIMVDANDTIDLEFGSKQTGEPDLFIDFDEFVRLWDSQRPVIALMKNKDMMMLRKTVNNPVNVISRQGKRMMVTNHPVEVQNPGETEPAGER
jgi:hypothetical protein